MTQVRIKRHRWHSRTLILLYSLWVGNDSKVSQSILLTTTPSAYELETHCFATLYGSSVDRSTKIVKLTCTLQDLQEYGFYYKGQDVFSGALEVAKFEGANVRTVSVEVKQGTLYRNQAVQFRSTSRLEVKVLKSC